MSAPAGRSSLGLVVASILYVGLAVGCVNGVGVVGEVAIGWALDRPPSVLVRLEPPLAADASRAGPLVASETRPTERVDVGGVSLPLAVNAYTGGPPDWPARLARALTGLPAAGTATNVALGLLLLALAHRFLRFHGTPTSAGAVALVLASDWAFVFYRKVLGGTEILLLASGLLVLWALWSRRWRGARHGTVAIAAGIGLGLLAKATFVCTLAALGTTALLTRRDAPKLEPPPPVRLGVLAGIVLLCVSPLLVALVHHATIDGPHVVSHDTLALQAGRLWRGWTAGSPAREGLGNLVWFLGNPLGFFHAAYGCDPVAPLSALRILGFGVTAVGIGLEWRDRADSASGALLRFLSLCVPLQLAFLFAANRDLHHLAQTTVFGALLVALAADRVAATVAPARSVRRALATLVFVLPHVLAGILHLRETDAVLATARSPSFTEAGQAALVDALRGAGVTRLVTSDYEVYGMLEVRAPEIAVTHTWGAISRGDRDPVAILRLAEGGSYLSIRPSAPMIYDWSPNERQVKEAAAKAGLSVEEQAVLTDGKTPWATVWAVHGAEVVSP